MLINIIDFFLKTVEYTLLTIFTIAFGFIGIFTKIANNIADILEDRYKHWQKINKKWYIIEGNIGSGKSTMLKLLKEHFKDDAEVIYEPVDTWEKFVDENGKNMLELFYEDQKRWGYTMQCIAFITRLKSMKSKQKTRLRFIERSVFTDSNVFALNCYRNKKMNKMEWNLYNYWHEWLTGWFNATEYDLCPNGYIYIKTDPEVALKRLKIRSRNGEAGVSQEYLDIIDKLHDEWLTLETVLIIDGNKDFENDDGVLKKHFENIEKFIDNT